MHVILWKDQKEVVIISQNSLDFTDYLFAQYETIFQGTRKECESFLETIESINN